MHLLCLGVTKSLLQMFLHGDRNHRIGLHNIGRLQNLLDSISHDIPLEFQRKKFDLLDIVNWKATQFRFFLLYCSGLFLSFILSHDKYQHFMLLYVSCRLLSNENLAFRSAQYSKILLRKFVEFMPVYYNETSLTITIHNLIHIADDVIHMKESLFKYSAFPFENCIGFIKKLLRNTPRPISQITRRIHELQQGYTRDVDCHPLVYSVKKYRNVPVGCHKKIIDNKIIFSRIEIKGMTFTTLHPNNIALMDNDDIVQIKSIFVENTNDLDDIILEGKKLLFKNNIFTYPTLSYHVRIMYVCESNIIGRYYAKTISTKCIYTTLNNKKIILTLLHS